MYLAYTIINMCEAANNGGAIYNNSEIKLYCSTNTISYCSATNNGGAIYSVGSIYQQIPDSVIYVSNCSAGVNGGAVYLGNGSETNSGFELETNFVASESGLGGSIYVEENAKLVLDNGCIEGLKDKTSAYNGAGIYNLGEIEVYLTIKNCKAENFGGAVYNGLNASALFDIGNKIENCEAKKGGAVYNISTKTLSMCGNIIDGCKATEEGGAIYSKGAGLSLDDSNSVDLEIKNCSAVDGGAIYIETGSLYLHNVFISNSTATNNGGAIYNTAGCIVDAKRGFISECTATNYGGAIYNNSTCKVSLGLDAGQFTISSCSAKQGGGVYSKGTIELINGYIESCSATLGAGIYNNNSLTMSGGGINNCEAETSGGAIFLSPNSEFTLDSGTLQGNTSKGRGGAVYCDKNSKMTMLSGSIVGKGKVDNGDGTFSYDASEGGAISNYGTLLLYGGKIENCAASSGGGAVYNATACKLFIIGEDVSSENYTTISNCFAAKRGGAIYNLGDITINNCNINNCSVATGTNLAADIAGGAIYNHRDTLINMNNGVITKNSAYTAGAILNLGEFTMNDGEISNNTCNFRGGAIYDYKSFIMNGGSINNNIALFGGGIYSQGSSEQIVLNDGEIKANYAIGNGGGLYTDKKTVYLNGTNIESNQIIITDYTNKGKGAGFLFYGGTAIMTAGEIKNNIIGGDDSIIGGSFDGESYPIQPYGAGLYMSNAATFTLSGGSIGNNKIINVDYGSGGNVYINGDSSVFVLENGTISGDGTLQATYGGGISNNGLFIMYGGEITNCKAEYGGGVYSLDNMFWSGGTITGCSATKLGSAILTSSELALIGTSDNYALAKDSLRSMFIKNNFGITSALTNLITSSFTDLTESEISLLVEQLIVYIDNYFANIFSLSETDITSLADQITNVLIYNYSRISEISTEVHTIINDEISSILADSDFSAILDASLNNISANGQLNFDGNFALGSNTFGSDYDANVTKVINGAGTTFGVQYRTAHISYLGSFEGLYSAFNLEFFDYETYLDDWGTLGLTYQIIDKTNFNQFLVHYLRGYSFNENSALNKPLFEALSSGEYCELLSYIYFNNGDSFKTYELEEGKYGLLNVYYVYLETDNNDPSYNVDTYIEPNSQIIVTEEGVKINGMYNSLKYLEYRDYHKFIMVLEYGDLIDEEGNKIEENSELSPGIYYILGDIKITGKQIKLYQTLTVDEVDYEFTKGSLVEFNSSNIIVTDIDSEEITTIEASLDEEAGEYFMDWMSEDGVYGTGATLYLLKDIEFWANKDYRYNVSVDGASFYVWVDSGTQIEIQGDTITYNGTTYYAQGDGSFNCWRFVGSLEDEDGKEVDRDSYLEGTYSVEGHTEFTSEWYPPDEPSYTEYSVTIDGEAYPIAEGGQLVVLGDKITFGGYSHTAQVDGVFNGWSYRYEYYDGPEPWPSGDLLDGTHYVWGNIVISSSYYYDIPIYIYEVNSGSTGDGIMYRYDHEVNVDPGKTITIKYDFGCITIISDSGTFKYNIQSPMYQYELVIEKGDNVINSIYHGEECEVLIDSNGSINLTVNLATA